ncbi:MAG: hypothetical protein LBC18_08770 [Opitutaceae bacterium]|nr:hypothetical protein [Opitutaceae bacterium]
MNTETAHRINGALCRTWFALHLFGEKPSPADLAIIRETTLAQAQSAGEVVEAENAAAPFIDGVRTLFFQINESSLPRFLERAKRVAERAGGSK